MSKNDKRADEIIEETMRNYMVIFISLRSVIQ